MQKNHPKIWDGFFVEYFLVSIKLEEFKLVWAVSKFNPCNCITLILSKYDFAESFFNAIRLRQAQTGILISKLLHNAWLQTKIHL
jgi:hypothetical protein